MISVFPAHAPSDAIYAQEIAAFLEIGTGTSCSLIDSAVQPGEDILNAAEAGLSADILLLLLSRNSQPLKWLLERWQSILFTQSEEMGTTVALWLLDESQPPPLLRRSVRTFDATGPRLPALRKLKRWIHGLRHKTDPEMTFSPDLESLYTDLADRSGSATASGAIAERFAREATGDFDAVFLVAAHGKTMIQIAGELGAQMNLTLEGEHEDNCRRIRVALTENRFLTVFDAPSIPVDCLMPVGKSSFLISSNPILQAQTPPTLATARRLVTARRYAEAYDDLNRLLARGIEPESCARELAWIAINGDVMRSRLNCVAISGSRPLNNLAYSGPESYWWTGSMVELLGEPFCVTTSCRSPLGAFAGTAMLI